MSGTVTASVSTKGRFETTLPLLLEAIAAQTVKPTQLVIWDDNPEMKDLRGISPYSHLFALLMQVGIPWYHLPGGRVGQVYNHQATLDRADTTFVWRLDDDNAPEPTCLERLLECMKDPSVGAAAGLVHDPKSVSPLPSFVTGKIEDIFSPLSLQWYQWSGAPREVDHLYSTFLYRVEAAKKAGGYSKELSPVGHREETIFSHEIRRAGYRLLVDPSAKTWHFREGTGGIRSYTDGSLWARDEAVFKRKLSEWGVVPTQYKFIVLDNGLGDHFMMKAVLPEIMARFPGHKFVLANCYPEVFEGVPGIIQASIADAHAAFGNLDQWDAYRWCEEHEWKRPFAEAYLEMYR